MTIDQQPQIIILLPFAFTGIWLSNGENSVLKLYKSQMALQ